MPASSASRPALHSAGLAVPRPLVIALLAVPALWGLGQFWPPLNHDVGALLAFTRRMLAGETLYTDLIDVNPPMVFWLNIPAVLLADALSIPTPQSFVATVLALTVASVALTIRLAQPLMAQLGPVTQLLIASMALFALNVLPAHSFGQREHLLLILTLPYLVLTMTRLAGATAQPAMVLDITVAMLAAIGIALKPYFLLVPVMMEGLAMARLGFTSLLHRVPLTILTALAAYLFAVLIAMPEYMGFVVPLVQDHYQSFSLAVIPALLMGDQVLPLTIAIIGFSVLTRSVPSALAQPLLVWAVALTLAGFFQAKGWDYHFVAARGAVVILAGLALGALIDAMIDRRRVGTGASAPVASAVAAVAALVWFLSGALAPPFAAQVRYADSVTGRLAAVVTERAGGRTVLWLSSSIHPQYPVLNHAGATSAMRWMSLWLLPALYAGPGDGSQRANYRSPEAMGHAENLLFRSIAADIVRHRPALVVVQDAAREGAFRGVAFDYLDYFRRDPRFSVEWQSYRLLTQIDGVRMYQRQQP